MKYGKFNSFEDEEFVCSKKNNGHHGHRNVSSPKNDEADTEASLKEQNRLRYESNKRRKQSKKDRDDYWN